MQELDVLDARVDTCVIELVVVLLPSSPAGGPDQRGRVRDLPRELVDECVVERPTADAGAIRAEAYRGRDGNSHRR